MTHHHDHEAATALVSGFTMERKPKSMVTISGEIPVAELEKHEAHVLEEMGKDVEIKGFRKGHVPTPMLKKHIGEMALFSEVAEHTLAHLYPAIIEHFKIDPVGRPEVRADKVAPGNPFAFHIDIAVMPDVTLPEYASIARDANKKKEDATVTEAEITAAIERIQRQKLSYDRLQEKARRKAAADEAAQSGLTLPTPETAGAADAEEDITKLPLPELTDDYVKTLGNFETVAAFKEQITTHLTDDKKQEAMTKHRAAITDELVAGSTIDLPEVLIRSELGQMFGQMEDDLTRAGLTIEGYLEHVKKTREDLIKEWTPTAEKRAKTQLILDAIAARESLVPDNEKVDAEVAHVLEHYKEADPTRVRVYVESVLRNALVMEFLERQ